MAYSGFDLAGKIALVTGASRGLGLEMARALAASGAAVIINGRSADAVQAAVEDIASKGGRAVAGVFDVSLDPQVAAAFEEITRAHGRLDILVNNVGMRDRRGLFEFELEAVRRLIEIDLIAPFNLSRRAGRLMADCGVAGRIVNVTSIAGPLAGPGDAVYTAAKGGLEALTRAMSAELGPLGVNVNAVAPGFFATESNAEKVADREIAQWLAHRTALGRWARPEEIAGAVVFLCSPAASYVAGQVIAVDGGYLSHF